MKKIVDFLKVNTTVYLATSVQEIPHVRAFGFMFEEKGELYFCTSNKKPVFQQLQVNKRVEICSMDKFLNTLRVAGRISFTKELDKKKKILEMSPLVKSIYKHEGNPVFEVFSIKPDWAEHLNLMQQKKENYME
ncbi:MAG: pyridoxamine 5'-phosphate oxidase family protein [Spirochaetaceae bacterium]|jgi:uncharacterized pyridoxamine 5'-phosphate oxidase family protein|nr:pyridoxamine 5'-phosphate oxidase family protein [Spirochaetaceae bacterium]